VRQTDTPSTHTIQYDTIEEFNVDGKAECGQLNLAHVARNKKTHKKEETKTNIHSKQTLHKTHRHDFHKLLSPESILGIRFS